MPRQGMHKAEEHTPGVPICTVSASLSLKRDTEGATRRCVVLNWEGPRGPFERPRGPLKGPRVPFNGPRGPLKGSRQSRGSG